MRAKAADASASGHAALTKRGGPLRMPDAFEGGARVDSRRSPDCVESNSFRLPQVRAARSRGPMILASASHIHDSAAEHKLIKSRTRKILAKVLQAGDTSQRLRSWMRGLPFSPREKVAGQAGR